jgi:hypothetical protein
MDASALSNSIAALRSSIKHLESCSNSLEGWLHFFVALVVIGVVLEVGFVFWEYREKLKEFRRGTIRSPQKPNGWILFFELLGATLVAIGVAGELGVDIKAGRIQTDLRTKNGELIQLLEGVSSSALSAASQNEKETAQLKKDAEGLKKTAEDERSARIKLQALIQPREYSASEQKRIIEACRPFSGHVVNIRSLPYDIEGFVFASFLAEVLGKTGLKLRTVDIGNNFMQNLPMTLDVYVIGPPDEQNLVKALAESLATPHVIVGPLQPPVRGLTTILVGAKRLALKKD